MAGLLLRGGRLVDPASSHDGTADVLVEDSLVAEVGRDLSSSGAEVLDCDGLVVAPGFVDLHAHLREPGREDAETVESGSRAAALGGYTAICAMPNTDPVADTAAVILEVRNLGDKAGLVDVYPAAAITKGLQGETLVEIGELAELGVRVFTDDGECVQSARVMRLALDYARAFDVVISQHAQDASLSDGWQMHEGHYSALLGLRGTPAEAESVIVARDVQLAGLTGGRLHVTHVSAGRSVELLDEARTRGVRLTADVTPHHLTFADEDLQGYDTNLRVNPPLRSVEDRDALRAGLRDGVLDAVATDHAPHAVEDKEVEFDQARPGTIGLETALAGVLTALGPAPDLPILVERLSTAPARILGLEEQGGPVAAGREANLTVFDPEAEWTVGERAFASRGRNSAFLGRTLRGRVVHTVLRGALTVRDGGGHAVTEALLALEDGRAFPGTALGAAGETFGEIVFNTGMSGYQEVLTDPSYARQIVVMTAPHQGNYGTNGADPESGAVQVAGFVVREASRRPSSWRAEDSLAGYLRGAGVVGLEGADTRALTLHIRDHGAMRAAISTEDLDLRSLVARVREQPGMLGADLARTVSTDQPYEARDVVGPAAPRTGGPLRVAAIDWGIKRNSLRQLASLGCETTVYPALTTARGILGARVDGVFLSNGPGDPAATTYAVDVARDLLGRVPLFGICLGHQVLGRAVGGDTYKLRFGHRGANQPVLDSETGRVEVTSHNHGFAVDPASLGAGSTGREPVPVQTAVGRAVLTHWNLNDGTLEGLRLLDIPALSVQYHPEAAPGPHDAAPLFGRFVALMESA